MYMYNMCVCVFLLLYLLQGVVGAADSCKTTLISAFHEGVVELGEDDSSERETMIFYS